MSCSTFCVLRKWPTCQFQFLGVPWHLFDFCSTVNQTLFRCPLAPLALLNKFYLGVPWHLYDFCNTVVGWDIRLSTGENMTQLSKFPIGVPWHLLDFCNTVDGWNICTSTSENMTQLSKFSIGVPWHLYENLYKHRKCLVSFVLFYYLTLIYTLLRKSLEIFELSHFWFQMRTMRV